MNKTTVKQGQCLADICMMAYGQLDDLMSLAIANNISITEHLSTGQEILLSDYDRKEAVLRTFRDYKTLVAVDRTEPQRDGQYVAEGYWETEYTN